MTDTSTLGHVFPLFQEFADDAAAHTGNAPFGFSRDKLTVPEGEQEAIHNLWSAPGGQADLHVWLAKPGDYWVDGANRPNFFEVTSLMAGECVVEEQGQEPITMRAGDTYVMQPGWTGNWHVNEYVEKAFVWVYV